MDTSMYNQSKTTGQNKFGRAFKTKTAVRLWGKIFVIVVKAKALEERDGLSSEQEAVFEAFSREKIFRLKRVEMLLATFCKGLGESGVENIMTPTQMLIKRNGECAMLFDYINNVDNGLAVVIFPQEAVMTQDEYFAYLTL